MFSLESFHKEHETDTVDVVVNGRKFQILLPKHLFKYIDSHDILHDFPLWAKIWQASWVLAGHLADMPVTKEKKFLEIGAGIGLVSIVAARSGHRITMTEVNPHALQFARANALSNGCPDLNILELDWNRPKLQGQFDYIVASEISYRKEDLQPLLRLFKKYLKPGGEVIIAGEMRRLSRDFYKELESMFEMGMQNREFYSEKNVKRVASCLENGGHNVRILDGNMYIIDRLKNFMPRIIEGEKIGMVFNMAYGIQGESRYTHIPSLLEMLGVPYIGSSPSGHTLALDKVNFQVQN